MVRTPPSPVKKTISGFAWARMAFVVSPRVPSFCLAFPTSAGIEALIRKCIQPPRYCTRHKRFEDLQLNNRLAVAEAQRDSGLWPPAIFCPASFRYHTVSVREEHFAMREFIKQQNRDIWRWSLRTVGQIATLPFRSLPGGSLKSLGIGIEQQVNRSVQASIRAGDNLQSKLVDWMFDAVTFKPLLDSFADLGFNSGVTGKGLQAQPELAYMEAVNDSRPGSSAVMIPMIVQYTS